MCKSNIRIMSGLIQFLEQANKKRENYCEKKGDFTKSKKLTFLHVILFIINMPRKTLSIELEDFYKTIKEPCFEVGKSAFSQARKKLKFDFFIAWNDNLNNLYYSDNKLNIKKWRGFKLFAVDGSTINLPERKDVKSYFGQLKNQYGGVAMGRIFCRYDVLNKIAVHTILGNIHTSEKDMAIQRLDEVGTDVINIYDRHYMSYEFAFLHLQYKTEFVIRCKLGFSNVVKEFVKSSKNSDIIELKATSKAIKNLRARNFSIEQINKNTKIRVLPIAIGIVKVFLDNGELEVLCTSLIDEKEYPTFCFKQLYGKRWGIETYYDIIKNRFQIELFSGQTIHAILQDFHATIFMSNIQSLITMECEAKLVVLNKRRTTHDYKINTNVSVGRMKNTVILIFIFGFKEILTEEQKINHITQAIEKLSTRFLKNIIPIRAKRKTKRTKRKRNQRGKYRTLKNYRKAI